MVQPNGSQRQTEELAHSSEWRFRCTSPHSLMCSSRPVPILGDPHSRSASHAMSLCLRRSLRASELGCLSGTDGPDGLTDRPALRVSAVTIQVGGLVVRELLLNLNQVRTSVGRLDLVLVHMRPIEWLSNPNFVKRDVRLGNNGFSRYSKAGSAETQSARFVGRVGRNGKPCWPCCTVFAESR